MMNNILNKISKTVPKNLLKLKSVKTEGKELVIFYIERITKNDIKAMIAYIEKDDDDYYKDQSILSAICRNPDDEIFYIDNKIIYGKDLTIDKIKAFENQNVFTFGIEGITRGIREEICQIGIDDFILSNENNINIIKEIIKYAIIQMGNLPDNAINKNSCDVFTVWKGWSTKSWTDCGYEYDWGFDYCGILDLDNLNILQEELKSNNDNKK